MLKNNNDKTNHITSPSRDAGIDFARATYITMMILYHCFAQAQATTTASMIDINRYLILVSGSFPFLAGFLVSNHYFNAQFSTRNNAIRLALRGVKLLLIYIFINIFLLVLIPELLPAGIVRPSHSLIDSIVFIKPSEVVYDILATLGFTLIIGSALILLHKSSILRSTTHIQIICIVSAIILAAYGSQPYIACALLGICVGFPQSDIIINRNTQKYPLMGILLILYGLALAFISETPRSTGIFYIIGVAGLFYAIRSIGSGYFYPQSQHAKKIICLFSQYSLLIYLVHVPVLVIMTRVVTSTSIVITWPWSVYIAFSIIIFSAMSLMIKAVLILRNKSTFIDKTYRLVFT